MDEAKVMGVNRWNHTLLEELTKMSDDLTPSMGLGIGGALKSNK